MRIATYNIHECIGGDGRFDPGRVLEVLEHLRADVVALQEVQVPHEGDDPLAHFAASLGCTAVAGPTLRRDGGSYGNALLSRWPVESVEHVDLSHRGREPRGAIDARVRVRDRPVRVVATHLGLRPAERRHQAERLLARFEAGDGDAISVLLGDLNEWFLWGRPLRWLHRAFARTPAPATFPARRPLFALDRIWVRPSGHLASLAVHRRPPARAASDHLPLVADLRL